MPRRPIPRDLQKLLVRLVRRDPRWLIVLVAIAVVILLLERWAGPPDFGPAPEPSAEGYMFCFWNVENLFDDTDDPKNSDPLDAWFANDSRALRRKLELLADAMLSLNDGKGPDILALVEVENRRAVEGLRATLNARLSTEWQYGEIVHVDNLTGRRIEPAIITRLPVDKRSSNAFGERRLLMGQLVVDRRPLVVLIGHWTSRVTDRDGAKRLAYAREMYKAYLEVERDSSEPADVLICGDFNDEPDDESVRLGLRSTGDVSAVIASATTAQPRLLNLMAGRDPERDGTYRYGSRWQFLDQVLVSPGLLDGVGWTAVTDSVWTVNLPTLRDRRGGPLRFGNPDNPNPRGASDHFAVSVRIKPPERPTAEGLAPDPLESAGR